jgi:hypothetical protein
MTKKGIIHGTFKPKMRFSSSLEKAAKIEYVAASKMAYPMMKSHIPMKPVLGLMALDTKAYTLPADAVLWASWEKPRATRKTAAKERTIASGIAAPANWAMKGVLKNMATEGAMNPMETTIASRVESAPPLRPCCSALASIVPPPYKIPQSLTEVASCRT